MNCSKCLELIQTTNGKVNQCDKCKIKSGIKEDKDGCWLNIRGKVKHLLWNANEYSWLAYKDEEHEKKYDFENQLIKKTCKKQICINPEHLYLVNKTEYYQKQKEKIAIAKAERIEADSKKLKDGIRNCRYCDKEYTTNFNEGDYERFCSLKCAILEACNDMTWNNIDRDCWKLYFISKKITYNWKIYDAFDAALLLKYGCLTSDKEKCKKNSNCVNPAHLEKLLPINEFLLDFNEYELKVFLSKYRSTLLQKMVDYIIEGDFYLAKHIHNKIKDVQDYKD